MPGDPPTHGAGPGLPAFPFPTQWYETGDDPLPAATECLRDPKAYREKLQRKIADLVWLDVMLFNAFPAAPPVPGQRSILDMLNDEKEETKP